MMAKLIVTTFAALMFAGLGGCTVNPVNRTGPSASAEPSVNAEPTISAGPRENTGTVVGAVSGAAVGSQVGGSTGARVAAGVTGAAVGGLIGNRIGAAMDDEDRQRAYAAQVEALESAPSGPAVKWRNPDSGRSGSIAPGPAVQQGGMQCRQYTHTVDIDGRSQTVRGTACRNPDGTWKSVG